MNYHRAVMGSYRFTHRIVGVLAVLAIALGGCDFFTDPPDNIVELEVDSSDGSQVLLITADRFSVGTDVDGVQIFNLDSSDTAWVATPYQETFRVTASDAGIGGFYAQAAASENPDATVSMQVVIDGDQAYADAKVLSGNGLQFYFRRY